MIHQNHCIVGPMVHDHWKPLKPMVEWPQNHRKTIKKQWSGGWKSVNGDGWVTQKPSKNHWCLWFLIVQCSPLVLLQKLSKELILAESQNLVQPFPFLLPFIRLGNLASKSPKRGGSFVENPHENNCAVPNHLESHPVWLFELSLLSRTASLWWHHHPA